MCIIRIIVIKIMMLEMQKSKKCRELCVQVSPFRGSANADYQMSGADRGRVKDVAEYLLSVGLGNRVQGLGIRSYGIGFRVLG